MMVILIFILGTLIDSAGGKCIISPKEDFVIKVTPFLWIKIEDLPEIVKEAIDSAPSWLRGRLTLNFMKMYAQCQEVYADLILSVDKSYRDEIAFQIATLDPLILYHYVGDPSIFVENVKLIYKSDSLLDYVELVEYPEYTTCRYRISDHGKDTFEIEIPKEIYYWDIVHPVIGWEAPLYIDPKVPDPYHTGAGEAPPPRGHFWREYYLFYPDTVESTVISDNGKDTVKEGYVCTPLKDLLKDEKILWAMKKDTIEGNGAIGKLTQWVKDVMVFNSGSERPWQPVRVYHMHMGRCGEHGHITGAAARAALIPATYILTLCNDHVWNEFYDEEWHTWEPVNTYINHPESYDNWWGGKAVLPFAFRGDGCIIDVTQRYTPHCTLTVFVADSVGNPVDGACVKLYATHIYGGTYICGWHYTNTDGLARFIIGDNVSYYIKIESDIGNYPSSGSMQIITISQPDTHYYYEHYFDEFLPQLNAESTQITEPVEYRVEITFKLEDEYTEAQTLFSNELGVAQKWFKKGSPKINFFICDEENYKKYLEGENFDAVYIAKNVDSGYVSFQFPVPHLTNWYIVFMNKNKCKTYELLEFEVKSYQLTSAGHIKVEKAVYDFGTVIAGKFSQDTMWIYNIGLGDLKVDSIKLISNVFDFEDNLPYVLSSHDSVGVLLYFAPEDTGIFCDTLFIYSDDIDAQELPVVLVGESRVPDIEFADSVCDFGTVSIGQTVYKREKVWNCGSYPLKIDSVISTSNSFGVYSPSFPQQLEEGDTLEMIIYCSPRDTGILEGEFLFYSNDPDENPAVLKLTARGYGLQEKLGSFYVKYNPNPCKDFCVITYYLPREEKVSLKIYDVCGRCVEKINSFEKTGIHKIFIKDLPSGVYFCEFKAMKKLHRFKIIFIR